MKPFCCVRAVPVSWSFCCRRCRGNLTHGESPNEAGQIHIRLTGGEAASLQALSSVFSLSFIAALTLDCYYLSGPSRKLGVLEGGGVFVQYVGKQ